MRALAYWRFLLVALLACVFFFGLSDQRPAFAGGPLIVGGTFGVDAQPFTWSAMPITYTTDQGGLGRLSNTEANTRVEAMFQVWEGVATATISYTRAASNLSFDVDTEDEFNQVEGDCAGFGNPIIYDVDGALFNVLGIDPNVIGFAGPCGINDLGQITSGRAALNGKFIDDQVDTDGDGVDDDLSDPAFNAVFIHEFGHFSGLDHSQINVNCLGGGCPDFSDNAFGLPTMFPFLLSGLDESTGNPAQLTLSPDDIAWISRLYPDSTFATTFGTIEGTIFFSDGQTPAQGVNVIARQEDDPMTVGVDESRRFAVSVVSGYLFTGNPGQSVTGTNFGSSFGSRDPTLVGFYRIPGLLPGNYTVEVESINEGFDAGSGVGPLNPPIPSPGPAEFWDTGESDTDTVPGTPGTVSVSAGGVVMAIDIILNGTPPRFDQFEN